MTPEIEAYMKKCQQTGRIADVFAGLDALGQTAWRVNEAVLKHLITAWNTGLPIAGLPAEIGEKPPEPRKPDNFDTDMMVRRQWYRDLRDGRQKYFDNKGLRATENYKLEIARAVRSLSSKTHSSI